MSYAATSLSRVEPTDDLEVAGQPEPGQSCSSGSADPKMTPDTETVRSGAGRLRAWMCAAGVTVAMMTVRSPSLLAPLILSVAALVAIVLAPDVRRSRLSVATLIPAGLVLSVVWALAWGLAGGAMGWDVWASRSAAIAAVALLLGATGTAASLRGGRVHPLAGDGVAVAFGGLLLGFFAWVLIRQPFAMWSRITGGGTDFLRHLRSIREIRDAGALHFGQVDYPQALHAWMAWLTSALGLPATPDSLWRAVAPASLCMLAVILLGLVSTAGRLTTSLQERRGSSLRSQSPTVAGAVAGGLTAVVFVQTAWFGVFLALGNIMNILVGVCLVALLALVGQLRQVGLLAGCLVGVGSVALTANAWQLLVPVVALGALPWALAPLRRRGTRAWGVVILLTGAVLTLNGLLIVRRLDSGGQASVVTVSGLFAPDWWWWVGLALALLSAGAAMRGGLLSWGLGAVGMLVGGAVVTTALFYLTHSTWDLMLYYPAKTLWTAIIVVIPLATSATVLIVMRVWGRGVDGSSLGRVAWRGGILVVSVVLAAGMFGRSVSGQGRLSSMADPSAATPTWAMAVEEAMEGVSVAPEAVQGAVVFGIVPDPEFAKRSPGYAGAVDYLAIEALEDVGVDSASRSPVKIALAKRDLDAICAYLRAYPRSLRVTGPDPAAGPDLLISSGCDPEIVQREEWVSLDIAPVWLTGTPWADLESTGTTQLGS